jgi:hypothetical protein
MRTDIKNVLHERVMELYRQREIEFPVRAAMARYMADQPGAAAGGQRYNREGLYYWAAMRFPQARDRLHEEDFRTQPRHRLYEMLIDISRSVYPAVSEEAINDKLDELFEGSNRPSDAEDAKELSEWARTTLNVDVPETALTNATHDRPSRCCGTPSTSAIVPRCGRWSAACSSISSIRRGRTTCTRWIICAPASVCAAGARKIPRRCTSRRA